ncbi:MAG: DUF805 domain-containing protein [Veillonellaceae bacterium]|nr:DUF805 domain-containing protein [Veillonellaceae bacterium]
MFCPNCGVKIGSAGESEFVNQNGNQAASQNKNYASNTGKFVRIPLTNTVQDERYTLGYIDNFLNCICNKYASFNGRATRGEYWHFALMENFILSIITFVFAILGSAAQSLLIVGVVVWVIAYLSMIVPAVAVSVRRLNDTDRSGWWTLLFICTSIGQLIYLIFMCLSSMETINKYGNRVHYQDASGAEVAALKAKKAPGVMDTVGVILGSIVFYILAYAVILG